MIIQIPPAEELTKWPTLGPQVWAWITRSLCYGPGDLLGEPIRMDAEWFGILCFLYQVWPEGHEWAGRRRFKRGAISRRKGRAKTELAAWITAAELHPAAPVRCVGWTKVGEPIGGAVNDPYIPLVAYTEEQGETTIYGALRMILERSKVANDFDIGLERVMRRDGTGRAEALAAEPNARDGARTTFQVFEETHRWYTPKLKKAYQTMMVNIPKRLKADSWSLEVTTSYLPGQNSIAEATMEHAKSVAEGRARDSRLFFSHRQAPDDADLSTAEGLRAAILEATGETAAPWSDIEGISSQFSDPNLDHANLCRLWLNQVKRSSDRAFDVKRWAELAQPDHVVPEGALITLGFDGSRSDDSTGIVATEFETGFQWVPGKWERPEDADDTWRVPQPEVEAVVADLFARFNVWRMYADPAYWETATATWAGEYGEVEWVNADGETKTSARVALFPTSNHRKMAECVRAFRNAQTDGSLSHDGDVDYARHVGNAHRKDVTQRDEDGRPLFVIVKDRHGSPLKIDFAVAGVLSWDARRAALASGVRPDGPSLYEQRAQANRALESEGREGPRQPLIDAW